MEKKFIPVNKFILNGNEKQYVNDCINSSWISSEGPYVKKFEENFSKSVDRYYGVAVSNGTAALEIAVKALNIGNGDEVIMPTFTIISCAGAIIKAGAKPVLVDSDIDTWNIDVHDIEKKITKNTKAIMVVHIYGLPVDMDPIINIANKYHLKIIEDAAEMHGQTYKARICGSFGDISTFSFYPNKHITTGEGGMIVTNSSSLADRCRSLRNLCFKKEKRFIHDEIGWNYRITNLQAAVGLAQLENLEKHIKKKRWIGSMYNKLLSGLKSIQLPLEHTSYAQNIYWVYGIIVHDEFSVPKMMKSLGKRGIGTRPFFYPMHKQPVFKKMGLFKNEKYPISEVMANQGFYIPSGIGLEEDEIKKVAEEINILFR